MSVFILFAIESPMLWVLVLLVIVLLFGASKLPQLAKALGQSRRAFREGQDEADEEARRERAMREAQQLNAPVQRGALAEVDDEQLFEEARRRAARLRAEEEKK